MGEDQDRSKVDGDIDSSLKRVYSTLLDEEVPDRFRKLLEELRQKEGRKK